MNAATEETLKNVTKPGINLNGSSARSLADTYHEASAALDLALDVLRAATPHGRDYQLTPGSYVVAAAEHRDRMLAVERVRKEMFALGLYCLEQGRR